MIEHGKRMPELGALIDFADFYDVSLDYLLGRDMAGNQDHQIYRQLRDIMERLDSIRVDEGKSELPVVKRKLRCWGAFCSSRLCWPSGWSWRTMPGTGFDLNIFS